MSGVECERGRDAIGVGRDVEHGEHVRDVEEQHRVREVVPGACAAGVRCVGVSGGGGYILH